MPCRGHVSAVLKAWGTDQVGRLRLWPPDTGSVGCGVLSRATTTPNRWPGPPDGAIRRGSAAQGRRGGSARWRRRQKTSQPSTAGAAGHPLPRAAARAIGPAQNRVERPRELAGGGGRLLAGKG
jgi:hypothetical protein